MPDPCGGRCGLETSETVNALVRFAAWRGGILDVLLCLLWARHDGGFLQLLLRLLLALGRKVCIVVLRRNAVRSMSALGLEVAIVAIAKHNTPPATSHLSDRWRQEQYDSNSRGCGFSVW